MVDSVSSLEVYSQEKQEERSTPGVSDGRRKEGLTRSLRGDERSVCGSETVVPGRVGRGRRWGVPTGE